MWIEQPYLCLFLAESFPSRCCLGCLGCLIWFQLASSRHLGLIGFYNREIFVKFKWVAQHPAALDCALKSRGNELAH